VDAILPREWHMDYCGASRKVNVEFCGVEDLADSIANGVERAAKRERNEVS